MARSRVSVPSQDAVIIVPGIMGSRLRDRSSGDVLWGLDADWYAAAWFRNEPWRRLAVTEEERAGNANRVYADALLDFGAFSPVLGGFEPYSDLHKRLCRHVADDAAVLDFPYDWRLSVDHNAALLADAVHDHIAAWRANPISHEAAQRRPNQTEPRVVIVAHSMGGLVTQAMCAIPGAADDVRAVLTLGTPFQGAAQAAMVLATGKDTPFPLPRKRLRRMAKTLPGLHDLLPVYASVLQGQEIHPLSDAEIVTIGGDAELGPEARARQQRRAMAALPGHSVYIGGFQPTTTMLRFDAGAVFGELHAVLCNADGTPVREPDGGLVCDYDAAGDGTVPLASAKHSHVHWSTIAQQHGALARVEEALSQAAAIVDDSGKPGFLGDTRLGIVVPDLVRPNESFAIGITGEQADSAGCILVDSGGHVVEYPSLQLQDGQWVATASCPAPGVYQLHAESGGGGSVRQTLVAQDPRADEGDDE